MRNHLTRSAALAAAGVLVVSLSACSSDSDATTEAFCDSYQSIEESTAGLAVDEEDPDAAIAALEEMTATLEAIEPPAEVADSFNVVASGVRTFVDGASEAIANPDDVDPEALTAALDGMTSPEFAQANAELEEFTAENCS